ncbi:MAG: hypothetical protein QG622_1018 [Actinomycetota bacterium]|nr:hypothetical protein [Actinomycetota bacterium]
MTARNRIGGLTPPDDGVALLRQQIEDLRAALEAIRGGGVDAVVIPGPDGDQVYTLDNADRPYRTIVEKMGEGAATISSGGIILFANERLAQLLGRPRTDLLGLDVGELVPPGDRGTFDQAISVTADVTRRAEIDLRRADGETVPVLLSVTGADLDDVLIRCLVATDLTEQRHTRQALSNANTALLHKTVQLRATTRQLQQVLLPGSLPALDGIEAAARYLPAGGDDVGGDWYDVLPHSRGRIGLVIGDVEGHDSTAAATMGQIRNVLRAHAEEGLTPAEILAKVNNFVSHHCERLATCCYAELNPATRLLTAASAGHPAPLVLEPGRAIRPVPVEAGVLLGVTSEETYRECNVFLTPGSNLLMFTDGLLDGLAGPPGPAALVRDTAVLLRTRLQVMADLVVGRCTDPSRMRDDVALLAVRLPAVSQPVTEKVSRVFGPRPSVVPAARWFVDDVLRAWDLSFLGERATLAVSELVTNAVVHTTSLIELTLCRLDDARLWIGVHDDNDRQLVPCASSESDISGRGLAILTHLVDRWGTEATPLAGGKTVWLELSG